MNYYYESDATVDLNPTDTYSDDGTESESDPDTCKMARPREMSPTRHRRRIRISRTIHSRHTKHHTTVDLLVMMVPIRNMIAK
jgi:hypothetical protein